MVRRGELLKEHNSHMTSTHVAVKELLSDGSSSGDTSTSSLGDFHRELELMMQAGTHPNVLSLIGYCLVPPPYLVLELMPNGNLRDYLRTHRATESAPQRVAASTLLGFCLDVAAGMEHLAGRRLVHRDLAARNVLVSQEQVCKVSDFGLARDTYTSGHYVRAEGKKRGERLPVKWMAPEAMADGIFTMASDVWSFGVVVWEIYELGGSPYPGFDFRELYNELVDRGYRMRRPTQCPEELYSLVRLCWQLDPSMRPDFARIRTRILRMQGLAMKANETLIHVCVCVCVCVVCCCSSSN